MRNALNIFMKEKYYILIHIFKTASKKYIKMLTAGKLLFNGTKFQFGVMKTIWTWIVVMAAQQQECT